MAEDRPNPPQQKTGEPTRDFLARYNEYQRDYNTSIGNTDEADRFGRMVDYNNNYVNIPAGRINEPLSRPLPPGPKEYGAWDHRQFRDWADTSPGYTGGGGGGGGNGSYSDYYDGTVGGSPGGGGGSGGGTQTNTNLPLFSDWMQGIMGKVKPGQPLPPELAHAWQSGFGKSAIQNWLKSRGINDENYFDNIQKQGYDYYKMFGSRQQRPNYGTVMSDEQYAALPPKPARPPWMPGPPVRPPGGQPLPAPPKPWGGLPGSGGARPPGVAPAPGYRDPPEYQPPGPPIISPGPPVQPPIGVPVPPGGGGGGGGFGRTFPYSTLAEYEKMGKLGIPRPLPPQRPGNAISKNPAATGAALDQLAFGGTFPTYSDRNGIQASSIIPQGKLPDNYSTLPQQDVAKIPNARPTKSSSIFSSRPMYSKTGVKQEGQPIDRKIL